MNRLSNRVGLVELGKIAGVSAATVSRALGGNPGVASATRERIERLAREHGFRLNHAASALRRKRVQAIGVVIPLGHEADQNLSDPFFMGLIGPLADAIADAGYDLLLSRVIPSGDDWLEDLVVSGRVGGVVVIGQSNQGEVIERAAARHGNIVVWGARGAGSNQITVGTDNLAGGRLAADHLIASGRKRLAFLGNPAVPEFAARYAGFQAATQGRSVTATLLPVHLTTQGAYAEITGFLDADPPIDGIVAASDVIAMSAMQALADHGKVVPRDVSVIGYDDVMIASYTTPPLTTIRQDVGRGAAVLIDLLLRRIEGEIVAPVEMLPELIVRGSA